jgi:mono/diheme cytochrome c family protein
MAQAPNGEKSTGSIDYLEQVKPLLRERCYACHGPLKQKAGLRLDTAALAIKGGDSGPAVKPGDVAGSLLLERVSAADPAERMPPEHEGERLSPAQIAELRDWIAAGASRPQDEQPEADPREHWAFRPISLPRPRWIGVGVAGMVAAVQSSPPRLSSFFYP